MFKFSKKSDGNGSDKAAGYIAAFILRMQFRLASWLGKQEKRWTDKQKKYGLAIFGFLAMLWISYLLASIFSSRAPHQIRAEWLRPPRDTLVKMIGKPATSSRPASNKF